MDTQDTNSTDKIPVWPDLVYREAIAVLIAMLGLGIISMLIDAPLESIADPSFSTNPSKAPWYFLGLQELLVYFSPWVAGVAIPTLMVVALMLLPYLDIKVKNKRTEHFPWGQAIRFTFTAGLVLWIILTLIGMELRGSNWDWRWPFSTAISSNVQGQGVGDLGWIYPLTIFIFLISAFLLRRKKIDSEINNFGFMRLFFAYFTAAVMFLIIVNVIIHIVVDLLLKFG
jgi:hypothetical protein